MVLTQFSECKLTRRRSASILASLDTIVPSKYYTQRHLALQSWEKKIRSWRRHSRSRTISASIVLAAAGRRRSWRGGRVCGARGSARSRHRVSRELDAVVVPEIGLDLGNRPVTGAPAGQEPVQRAIPPDFGSFRLRCLAKAECPRVSGVLAMRQSLGVALVLCSAVSQAVISRRRRPWSRASRTRSRWR